MGLYLDESLLLKSFNSSKAYKENQPLNDLIKEQFPKERRKMKRLFQISIRIMKASKTDDLSDVSLEDIIECTKLHDVIVEIFSKANGEKQMQKINDAVISARNMRKRRVL